ncbi:hypothetical protein PTTG_06182 [Puccinia triticina 1-1 BBBD Race 1]|uniref:Uncharacterized protein n=1 Tax=Puccinia triticina (isolate 1-1 / race 1 (BBBD)) TaxID=630390 RepID=A0A180GE13_PUCT1|nr:hypothetical protein PTTG_06182 [Puccinia triticina 1-1 BBBD Race 1]
MTPIVVEPAVSKHREASAYQYLCLVAHAGHQDENSSPRSDGTSSEVEPFGADNGLPRKRTGEPPLRDLPVDSNTRHSCQARRLPLELRFTPVNSPTDNTGPVRPSSSGKVIPPHPSSKANKCHARHCRLIGFTPLAEDTLTSSEEDSIQFLGPRKVKAKEVAPCALFYKRSDVFVSSEMASQNVLAYSENHYRNLRFDDEISISEIEYAPQPTNQVGKQSQPLKEPISISALSQSEVFQANENDPKIQPEPHSCMDREPIVHAFSKNRLTSMPLTSESESGAHFSYDYFHLFSDETGSQLTTANGAERITHWESPYKSNDLNSDLEKSISSINSCGIQSSVWDSTLSSLTRATSPVSSIYSSVVPIYDNKLLGASIPEERSIQSQSELMEFSHFTINTQNEPGGGSMTREAFNWEVDHGSLADDENDSDCSSVQLESDDDRELEGYAYNFCELNVISSPSPTGFGKKGETVLHNKSGKLTPNKI